MKRYFFLCGCLLTLFASSCSDDIMDSGGTGTTTGENGKCMITISLPRSNTRTGEVVGNGETNASGTCVVDTGLLLIFESNARYNEDYALKKSVDLSFVNKDYSKETGYIFNEKRYTAAAEFVPEKGKFYRLYAYAYNSNGVKPEFDYTGKVLQNLNEKLGVDRLASIAVPIPSQSEVPTFNEDVTQEIYGGFLDAFGGTEPYPQDGSSAQINQTVDTHYLIGGLTNGIIVGDDADQYVSYGADIRRQTGRLDITLSEMTSHNVKKATLLIERYTDKAPIGMEVIPEIGYYNPFEKEINEIKVVTATPDTEGKIRLCADMLRFENSYVYIELEYEDGKKSHYLVRSADKEVPAGPDATVTQISKDFKITLLENIWILMEGTYDNLVKNNLKIKVNWEADVEGPDLIVQ